MYKICMSCLSRDIQFWMLWYWADLLLAYSSFLASSAARRSWSLIAAGITASFSDAKLSLMLGSGVVAEVSGAFAEHLASSISLLDNAGSTTIFSFTNVKRIPKNPRGSMFLDSSRLSLAAIRWQHKGATPHLSPGEMPCASRIFSKRTLPSSERVTSVISSDPEPSTSIASKQSWINSRSCVETLNKTHRI